MELAALHPGSVTFQPHLSYDSSYLDFLQKDIAFSSFVFEFADSKV